MANPGIIQYVREAAEEGLANEKDPRVRFTLGMLVDILERVEHTVDTRDIAPAKLLHITVKVFASSINVMIMELAKNEKEDTCKKMVLEHMADELDESMSMYKDVLQKRKDFV